jgi:ribosomal-protein-alanine N-acetyltransferase
LAPTIEPPERIGGQRMVLRPLAERDLTAYAAAFAAEPALGAALGSETDPDDESLRGRPHRIAEAAASGEFVELAIAHPRDDRLLGTVTLHSFEWCNQRAEAGFWIAAEARGAGVATEALGEAIDWAFKELDLHRMEMTTAPGLPHEPKVLALAERLGFVREGVLRERNFERGRRLDVIMLAVLRADWIWPSRRPELCLLNQ